MATLRKIYTLIAIFMLCFAGTWATPQDQQSGTLWHIDKQKSYTGSNPFEEAQISQPDDGYYRDPKDFPIPSSWTSTMVNRFISIGSGYADLSSSDLWSAGTVNLDTKWSDSKSVEYVTASVNTFNIFTYFYTVPATAVIEQDFKGHARISNLRDNQRYKVYCYDFAGKVGTNVIALASEYIKVLPGGTDTFGGNRYPIMAQEVVEDPNKDIWASVYDIDFDGTNYRGIDIYQIDKDFNIKSKFEVQSSVTFIRPWESDFILKDDGNLVFAASETPDGYGGYDGSAYIAEIDKDTGATIWQADPNQTGSCLGIVETPQGYAYGGASWNSSGEQYGNIVKLDNELFHDEWGYTGTTEINAGFIIRDMVAGDFHQSSYTGTRLNNELYDQEGGTASTDFSNNWGDGAVEYVFDNIAKYYDAGYNQQDEDDGSGVYTEASYTSGVSSNYAKIYFYGNFLPGFTGSIYLEGSDNDADWDIISGTSIVKTGSLQKFDPTYDEVQYQYYRVRMNAETTFGTTWAYYRLTEFELYLTSTVSATEDAPYIYTVGQQAEAGVKLYVLAGATNELTCSGGWHPSSTCNDGDLAWDENLGTYSHSFLMPNIYFNSSFPSSRTLAQSDFHYKYLLGLGGALDIRLQYWENGTWNTYEYWNPSTPYPDGALQNGTWSVSVSGVDANEWRIWITDESEPTYNTTHTVDVYEWETYGITGKAASIAKINGASGTTEGQEEWAVTFEGGVSEPGIFYSVIKHPKYTDRLYAAGSTDKDQTDLSQNEGVVGCVDTSGNTIFYINYPEFSSIYNLAPVEDGSILLSGALYSGTSLQQRSMVIGKINKDGDLAWTQTYQEDDHWNDGRGIIETRDRGILAVGGSSDKVSASKPYFVKTNRFGKSCSQGNPCD